MKFLFLLLTVVSLQVFAEDFKETITISKKNASLKEIFRMVQKQSDYSFAYTDPMLSRARLVDIDVKNAGIEQVLSICFREQPLEYEIDNSVKVIIVKEKQEVVRPTTQPISLKKRTVSGRVIGQKNEPLAGATITVRRSNQSTTSNENGYFTLSEVEEDAVLVVSSVGYVTQQVRLNNNESFEIRLPIAIKEEEEVVVAYSKVSQRSNTGAVTVVKGEQIQALPNRSFDRSLQGLVPGLVVTSGTGQPGGGLSNIVLRGISTGTDAFYGSTVRNPLIIIDGIPVSQEYFHFSAGSTETSISNPLAQLNPSDIETISILKDAAAIALYGSKASNGVILVTTKKGKLGKISFAFRHQTDISSRLKGKMDVLDRQEYLDLLFESYKNSNSVLWTNGAIQNDLYSKFPYVVNGSDTSFYPDANWFDALYTKNAVTVSNEISVSGGNEKINFYLNFEYTKQNGVVKKTGYDRKSLRLNLESRPTDWLKLGTNSTFSYNIQDYANPSEGISSYAVAPVTSPLNPIYLADGNYFYNSNYPFKTANPVAAAELNINQNVSYRGLSKIYGEIQFLKNFTFTSTLGVDFMLAELKEKIDPRLRASGLSAGSGKIQERNRRRANLITTNILKFDKTIKQAHTVTMLFGQEAQVITEKGLMVSVRGASVFPYYDEINSSGYSIQDFNGYNSKQTLLSLFGQANYGYKNKYFLSTSVRRDGSSRFGDRQKWATYWSSGIGWVVTEEAFLKDNSIGINYLKFRGSIGSAGSSAAVGANTRYDQLDLRRFMNDFALTPSVSAGGPGNPDIRWEETFTWDAGLEARILNNKVVITADLYNRKTSDLIYSVKLPTVTGFSTVLDNIGDMKNSGIELSISADIVRNKNFRWNVNANWSSNQNKLVKANVPLTSVTGGVLANEEGRNFNSFYMPVWAGVNVEDGKPQWFDSTGKPTSTYNVAKKEFVGKPQPDGFGAVTNTFTYKGFEVSALLYYQYGFQIYDNGLVTLLSDGSSPYTNQVKQALDRWKKPGDKASNPRNVLGNIDGGTQTSTRYLFNGDYIRLQNVSVSYNFSKTVLDRLKLGSLRVFVQGHNLAVWTKFPGLDPDNMNVGGGVTRPYPNQKSFSVGLNVNF